MYELRVCPINDIMRCEAEHNYTTFYFTNAKPLLISKTIKEYDDLLKEYGFERIHQSHLINIAHLKSIIKKDEGYYAVMNDSRQLPIARRKKDQVLEKFRRK